MLRSFTMIVILGFGLSANASFARIGWSTGRIQAVLDYLNDDVASMTLTIQDISIGEGSQIRVRMETFQADIIERRFVVTEQKCGLSACPFDVREIRE